MAIDDARAAGFARLRVLRRQVLSESTSEAFLGTSRLAPFVRARAEARRPADASAAIDPGLAAQLIGLGAMTAVCEWSILLGDDRLADATVLRLR